MAEADSISQTNWRVSENRPLAPFPQDRHALDATAFTPFAGDEPHTDISTYFIPENFDSNDFRPTIRLAVDVTELERNIGIRADDLSISLTVRDHATKNYSCLNSWPVTNFPIKYDYPANELDRFSFRNNLTFCVVVSIPEELPRRFGQPHFPGSVLAEKRFHVRKEPIAPQFPIKIQPPEFFVGRGLPNDTLWVVDVGADVTQSAEAAVTIYLNQIAAKKLNKAFSGNVAGGLLKNQILSEIFTEVCQRVLLSQWNEPVEEEDSLIYRVLQIFQEFELSTAKLKKMAKEPGGWQLRCYVQSFLNITNAIARADLRRPWQR